MAQLVHMGGPDDPGLEGALYEPQVLPEVGTAQRSALDRERPWEVQSRLRATGRVMLISGAPLSSEARTEFTLDGLTYCSVWAFYQALKVDEHDPQRAEIAAGTWHRRSRLRPTHRGYFHYGDEQYLVNSRMHALLVARATEAKVLAHASVREALARTGTSRLAMGDAGSEALGRWMPLVLMVMRLRLFRG